MADQSSGSSSGIASPSSSAEGVAPAWKTASIILGSLAALLTAIGPITAWITGLEDRRLQERTLENQLSLRYMDLLLEHSESDGEREAVLRFLEKVLSSDRPRKVMEQIVREQLDDLARISILNREVAESKKIILELESKLNKSRERERALGEVVSSEGAALRHTISGLETQLYDEKLRNTELSRHLEDARNVAGVSAGLSTPKVKPLDYFRDWPEEDVPIARGLDELCVLHGGTSEFTYYGRNDPGVRCTLGDDLVVYLDKTNLEVNRFGVMDLFGGRYSRLID